MKYGIKGSILNLLLKWRERSAYLNYGRDIIAGWTVGHIRQVSHKEKRSDITILDCGLGQGDDLINILKKIEELKSEFRELKLYLKGIEKNPTYIEISKSKGIDVFPIDLETDIFPIEDGSIDVVIINQVLEHTKEIFWIMDQIQRILRAGGILIVGVPNLASLHNRILLLLGYQPTAQRSLGSHVRTFTIGDLKEFIEYGGMFKLIEWKGDNLYPFPPPISKIGKFLPSIAYSIFAKFERTEVKSSFLKYLHDNFLETPFYGSPQKPARSK